MDAAEFVVCSPHDSHGFAAAYSGHFEGAVVPLYECIRCHDHTIRDVTNVVSRAHVCKCVCVECGDGLEYENPDLLEWHMTVVHGDVAAAEPRNSNSSALPVSSPYGPGSQFSYLTKAIDTVESALAKAGVVKNDPAFAYMGCNVDLLCEGVHDPTVRVPPATFLAVGLALANIHHAVLTKDPPPMDATVTCDTLLSAILPAEANGLSLDKIRDVLVKLAGFYKGEAAFKDSDVQRLAARALTFIVEPPPLVHAVSRKRRRPSIEEDALTSDSPVASPITSWQRARVLDKTIVLDAPRSAKKARLIYASQ